MYDLLRYDINNTTYVYIRQIDRDGHLHIVCMYVCIYLHVCVCVFVCTDKALQLQTASKTVLGSCFVF